MYLAQVRFLYERQYFDMTPFYKTLSEAGVRGLVYNGDTDMACNYIGDQWFVEQLGYPVRVVYVIHAVFVWLK